MAHLREVSWLLIKVCCLGRKGTVSTGKCIWKCKKKNSERVKKLFQIPLLKNEMCIQSVTLSSISNGAYENMILKIIYLGDFFTLGFFSILWNSLSTRFPFGFCGVVLYTSLLVPAFSENQRWAKPRCSWRCDWPCCDALAECTMPGHWRRF